MVNLEVLHLPNVKDLYWSNKITVQWDNIGPTHYNQKPYIKPTICHHFRLNKDHSAKQQSSKSTLAQQILTTGYIGPMLAQL